MSLAVSKSIFMDSILLRKFVFIVSILLLFITKSDGVKKTYYVENDTRKIPIVHVEGVLGHRVEMPCDIIPKRRDDTVYMVFWFRESAGKPLYSFDVRGRGMKTAKTSSVKNGFDRRADFQTGSFPAHLLVSDVQLSDEGLYRCRVDYRYSQTRNALVNLTVVVPPSMPEIYDESGQEISSVLGPYLEGSDVRLTCRVHGGKPEPVVAWHVNGELEDATYHSDRYGNVINELLFRGLNRSHLNSQFSCKASNTRLIQPVEKAVVLDLNLKPLYVRMKQKQAEKLVAGREYRLVCETAGSKPPAVLKWIKGGKEITQVSTQDMEGGNVTQSTFMFIPTPGDNGATIVCRAENPWLNRTTTPFHVLEESWTINVVYLPEVRLSLGSTLNPLEVKEGTDVYFECRILANPKITRLAWFFNDEELKHTPTAGIIMSNQSLVLQGITRKSAGNYTCIATNAEGSTPSNAVHLSVQYTPVCQSDMGVTVGAAKGEHIGLRCSVDSSPIALRFEWEFHGTGDSVDVVPDGRVMSQGDLSRFLYTPQTDAEFGTFLCWASNDIGRQVQPCVFHVVPAVKPHPLENCTVVNQSTTMIHVECSAHRELPQIPDQPLFRIMHGDPDNPNSAHDPSQYGLFPEYYVMEVWDLKNRSIRKNLSAETPVFILKGLAPGSLLRLVLYAANSHGKSEPHVIEAVVAGDAEKHILGASTSKMEFFPLAAVGVGLAVVGTLLLLFLVMVFRTRLTSTNNRSRTVTTQPNSNSNNSSHPLEKPNSLLLTPGLTSTNANSTNNTNSTNSNNTNNSAGYRPLPQSKSEADANPDIIPGANGNGKNFSADYKEELQRTLSRKGIFIPSTNPVMTLPGQENCQNLPTNGNPYSNTLPSRPRPIPPQHQQQGLGLGGGENGSFHPPLTHHHPNPHQIQHQHPPNLIHHPHNQHQYQTLHHPKSNYVNDYPPPHYHHGHSPLPTNDYNTIYIRDKMHDSDIPESCV